MKTDFDTDLRAALIAYNRAMLAALPEEAEYTADFSPRHQRRMARLFARCDRFYYPAIRTKARRVMALAATITLVLALPFSVGAVRESFTQFASEVYTVCTDLFFPASTSSTTPFVPTEPTYIPEGFKEVFRETDEISNYIEYRNSDNEEILFYQYQNNEHIASVDTENAQVEKVLLKDSIEAMYVYKNNHSQMIFTYKNNVFRMMGQLSKDQIIAIAESLVR